MRNDYQSPDFKKWLDKLQQESWQLELIISGFAIFGLFTAFEPIIEGLKTAQNAEQSYKIVLWLVALISCSVLAFNLVLHVILRGLWIGALGLRYVSGDINYDNLNYSKKFTNYLKKKVGSFDKYIATLENYCSVLFAVSFLLIFYLLSFFVVNLVVSSISFVFNDISFLSENIRTVIGYAFVIFFVGGMLLTFIDFVTQGILKKKQWISKIYFPFYWVFSILTFSFLYRPLVYNFLDNKFGKRLSFMLLPFYIAILVLITVKHRNSNYLTKSDPSSEIYANSRNYDDYLIENDAFVKTASIPSKVINTSFLKIFMVYDEGIEDNIFKFNKSLNPDKDKRGLYSDIITFSNESNSKKNTESITNQYLKTFNEMHEVVIDSINYNTEFILASNTKEQLGFETFTNIISLKEGKHTLKIKRLEKIDDGTSAVTIVTIPFWYYND